MNLFFDMEFTGLRKDTTPISIGIISENGKKFYAEFSDYDREQCDEWIKENVINHLMLSGLAAGGNSNEQIQNLKSKGYEVSEYPTIPTSYSIMEYGTKHEAEDGTTKVYGDCGWVSLQLEKWLSQFKEIQFVSDVCHYDMVLLIDIFGGAFDLPENVSAVCHDINQDIARYYGVPDREAFDKNREYIVSELCGGFIAGNKHNALYDAEVIKAIYEEVI